ncbi:MAG TPA: hypothetical protein VFX50_12130, partial [Gemmatimonadales bacterium]|nr:hypothetical protein [Gemmatimonadales bacterium]
RRFFVSQGRAERPRKTRGPTRTYAEVTVGEARQLIEVWNRYAATAKPVEGYRDPRAPWRAFVARAEQLMAGKRPGDLYPVEEAEALWVAQWSLGRDLSVLKDGQPRRGWSVYIEAVKERTADLLDGAGDAASAVGGAASGAAKAVARGAGGLLKPVALGVGAVAGVALIATLLRR